jgi:transcriptional regulator with XRE-family HTH domain
MTPSEQLVRFIREAAKQKGLNTASLAASTGISRNELKHVLSGSDPLTVDLMVSLAEALDLGPEDLTKLGMEMPPAPEKLSAIRKHHALTDLPDLDPYGNHAEQVLRLGFGLGCDMHVVLHSERLEGTSIPAATLEQFPDLLPIKLDAEHHHHNDPRFTPEGVQLVLSFDALYTTVIPWEAFAQITMIPLEPELGDVPEAPVGNHPHLRLIE